MVQTRRTPGATRGPNADHNLNHPPTATIPDPADTWLERLDAMLAERQRKLLEIKQFRAELKVRRDRGKAILHARRLRGGGSGE